MLFELFTTLWIHYFFFRSLSFGNSIGSFLIYVNQFESGNNNNEFFPQKNEEKTHTHTNKYMYEMQ